jgi:asparagine synthase (glutamine-hydrolysing)
MCGIFGLFSSNFCLSSDSCIETRLSDASCALYHRGPDNSNIVQFIEDDLKDSKSFNIALGHTRLSVIDLTSQGNQPLTSKCGRYILSYNGEIYNYLELRKQLHSYGFEFKTNCDSEVLLNSWVHWNLDSFHRLNGMFAFVVYDKFKKKVTLVRDAFGIKPLFFSFDKSGFYFASEINALSKLVPNKPTVNWSTAYNYLTKGRVDRGCHSFLEGINHLQPGHYLEIDLNSFEIFCPKRWWNPSIKERDQLSFKKSALVLREKFLDNVRLQLRSDVPVGAALSGGIDSSAVVSAMRYLEPSMEIKTFSFISKGSSKNEEKWVDIVNEHVGAKPHKIDVKKTDIFNDLETLIKIQGEPFGSPSIYAQYRVFKEIAKAGVVVNLDGQGADELLAGYFGYPHARFESLIAKRDILKILRLYNGLGQTFGKYPTKEFIQALFRDISEYFVAKRSVRFQNSYLKKEFSAQFAQKSTRVKRSHNHRALSSFLSEALTGQRGLVHLLRYEDRNSMSHSIESRVPFLTIDMAEFLLSLPENFLLSDEGVTKYIFREAMRGIVPDEILDRKDKIGFETPDNQWLLAEKNTITKWLKQFDQIPILDSSKALLFYESLCNGKNQDFLGFWRLLNFYKWYEQNNF